MPNLIKIHNFVNAMVKTNMSLALPCFKMSVKVLVSKKVLASTAKTWMCWAGIMWWNYRTIIWAWKIRFQPDFHPKVLWIFSQGDTIQKGTLSGGQDQEEKKQMEMGRKPQLPQGTQSSVTETRKGCTTRKTAWTVVDPSNCPTKRYPVG